MYLLAICTFCFENSLFNSCAPFIIGVLILWGWVFWVHSGFWILVPYWMNSWQRFSCFVGCPLSIATVSFSVQKLFSLMHSHLLIFPLRCWAFWVQLWKSFPMPMFSNVFPTTVCCWFKVSGLLLRSLIQSELILAQIFYMWISSFPSSIWRGCLFSIVCFGFFCWRSVGCSCVDFVWVFYSNPLVFLAVFVPIPCCFHCYSSII
jgi:hypothetical protein